jgi:hypothetical protein
MIWFVIIAIIGYILYRFIKDSRVRNAQVRGQGGMLVKYQEMVAILKNLNFQVEKVDLSSIFLFSRGTYGSDGFTIIDSFGKTIIVYKSKNANGQIKDKWEFQNPIDQDIIAEKFLADMQFKIDLQMGN